MNVALFAHEHALLLAVSTGLMVLVAGLVWMALLVRCRACGHFTIAHTRDTKIFWKEGWTAADLDAALCTNPRCRADLNIRLSARRATDDEIKMALPKW